MESDRADSPAAWIFGSASAIRWTSPLRAASYARRNANVFEHLGDVLRDLGRHQEARRNWEFALEYSVEAGVIARLKDKIKNTQ